MTKDSLSASNEKHLRTRLEVLQYLHLGFGVISLFYILLQSFLKTLLLTLFENQEIVSLIYDVYGLEPDDLLILVDSVAYLSTLFLIATSTMNLWAAWALYKRCHLKYIRWVAWANIGMPPIGTILGIITLSCLKKKYVKSLFSSQKNSSIT